MNARHVLGGWPEARSARRALAAMATVLLVVATPGAFAAELPRRPSLGVELVPSAEPGVQVNTVPDGIHWRGPALQVGDRIIALGGTPVGSPAEASAVLRKADRDAPIAITAARGNATVETRALIVAHPLERGEGFAIDYATLPLPEGRRRLVLTRPEKAGPKPAVLMIGGLGCYPADNPFNADEAQRALTHAATRAGFITLRVEKSGAGDSEGPPCAIEPMATEVRGLVAGLRWLRARPDVDRSRVFIVGLSMGGIVGPLVAAEEPITGMALFEIVGGTSWFEYELENRRRQLGLRGQTAEQIDTAVRERAWCLMTVMVDKRPRAEAIAARPGCERELRYPVSDDYMRDVFAQNIPALFAALDGMPTLVVYGSADFVTSSAQGEGLAAAINAAHPGRATFVEIAGMDHWLSRAVDQRASFDRAVNQGRFIDRFHPEAAQMLLAWLDRDAHRAP